MKAINAIMPNMHTDVNSHCTAGLPASSLHASSLPCRRAYLVCVRACASSVECAVSVYVTEMEGCKAGAWNNSQPLLLGSLPAKLGSLASHFAGVFAGVESGKVKVTLTIYGLGLGFSV
jgi:hypothetical protein